MSTIAPGLRIGLLTQRTGKPHIYRLAGGWRVRASYHIDSRAAERRAIEAVATVRGWNA